MGPLRYWLVGVLLLVLAGGTAFWLGVPQAFLSNSTTQTQSSSPSQTETAFIDNVDQGSATADVIAERREARGDHKMIAYVIVSCEGLGSLDIMPRETFSALLLDLTPVGEHKFPAATGVAVSKTTVSLTPYEEGMLFLSDGISRARLTAAKDASKFRPNVTLMGWLTVIISALATLFVTIKSSMSAPPAQETTSTTPKQETMILQKLLQMLPTRRFWYPAVGIIAMILSAVGTVLTTAKAFYDPTRSYIADERALLDLKQLHQEVAYSALTLAAAQPRQDSASQGATAAPLDKCKGGTNDPNGQHNLEKWSKKLNEIQTTVILASLPISDSDKRGGSGGK